jgi:hypothetical protein
LTNIRLSVCKHKLIDPSVCHLLFTEDLSKLALISSRPSCQWLVLLILKSLTLPGFSGISC